MPRLTEERIHIEDALVRLVRLPRAGVFPLVYFDTPPAGDPYVIGVQIADHAEGVSYVVTVESGQLTSRFDAALDASTKRDEIAWMSDRELAALSTAFLRRRGEWFARQVKAGAGELVADGLFRYGEHEERASEPTAQAFAAEACLAREADVPLVTWFGATRHPWAMSPRTVARWIVRAREAGYEIPNTGTPGRPRKTMKASHNNREDT